MARIVTLTMNPALDIATSIERIIPNRKLRCDVPRYDPGGGGINVARACHALGVDALAIFPGGGAAGELIGHLLRQEGVDHTSIPIGGFTRENLNVAERDSGQQYRFVLPGPEIGSRDQQACLDALEAAAVDADYIVASGSLPPGVPEDFYARVGDVARRLARRLVLDASGPALRHAGAGIHLLKPSLGELEGLLGHPVRGEREEEQAAHDLIGQGRCEIAIITLGARGALLVNRDSVERLPAPQVESRTAAGAGDSMLAGTLVGLIRGLGLGEAARFGVAAGAAALLGAGTPLCRREDVERLYRPSATTA